MKVAYTLKMPAEIKELKETLKPYGGKCAKIIDGKVEYQISGEQKVEALNALKEKGYVE